MLWDSRHVASNLISFYLTLTREHNFAALFLFMITKSITINCPASGYSRSGCKAVVLLVDSLSYSLGLSPGAHLCPLLFLLLIRTFLYRARRCSAPGSRSRSHSQPAYPTPPSGLCYHTHRMGITCPGRPGNP